MLGSSPGCEPRVPGLRAWPHWVLWRLGGLLCLLGLEGAFCLAGPGSSPPAVSNNNEGVNVYMSLEEVKKFLGKFCVFCFTLLFGPEAVSVTTSQLKQDITKH